MRAPSIGIRPASRTAVSYFSFVLDYNEGTAEPEDIPQAGSRSASLISLTTLPVGVSYYQAHHQHVDSHFRSSDRQADRLTTHDTGITVVHSLTEHIALGATLKWVRGYAASGTVPDGGDRDDLLDAAGDLPDLSTNKFDADIGVLALYGKVRAGLTIRNVAEPDFSTPGGGVETLKRQTRAGVAYVGVQGLIVAADVDLERAVGSLGEVQDVATGAEAKLFRRVACAPVSASTRSATSPVAMRRFTAWARP